MFHAAVAYLRNGCSDVYVFYTDGRRRPNKSPGSASQCDNFASCLLMVCLIENPTNSVRPPINAVHLSCIGCNSLCISEHGLLTTRSCIFQVELSA